MNDDLPGTEFAKDRSYKLHSHGGNRKSATYIKYMSENCIIYLTCNDGGTGELTRIIGLITCTTGEISIPNKNFDIFERQLINLK